jgi:hypothetical protein
MHQPKGSLCINCAHVDRDCSFLSFDEMQVIKSIDTSTQVVMCDDYNRIEKEYSVIEEADQFNEALNLLISKTTPLQLEVFASFTFLVRDDNENTPPQTLMLRAMMEWDLC